MIGPISSFDAKLGRGFGSQERTSIVAAQPQAPAIEPDIRAGSGPMQRAGLTTEQPQHQNPTTPTSGPRGGQITGNTRDYPRHWLLPVAVIFIGMFMSVLNTSIVNGAMPAIENEFDVTSEDIQWISIAYKIGLAVVLPASAWLSERLGIRRMYLIILLLFGITAALCGMSTGLDGLIFFRILQAVPGALAPVASIMILYRLVPRQKLGLAMSMYAFLVIAPGSSSLLSGFMVEHLNWRWIFYFEIPVSVLGMIVTLAVLPSLPGQKDRRFDLPGFASIALGLGALMLALSKGQDWGWSSYRVLILFALGVNAMALFVVVELAVREPLLDLKVFSVGPFVVALALLDVLFTGALAVLGFLPQFLLQAQGLTPTHTGQVLLPLALTWMVVTPTAGQIYIKFGPRWPTTIGLLLFGGGTLLLTRVNIDLPRPELIPCTCIWAAGLGLALAPLMAMALALPPELINDGCTFRTIIQRITSSFGLFVFTALETTQQAQFMADRSLLLKGSGANADPRILQMEQHGPDGLIGLWQELQRQTATQAYSNVFLIVGAIALVGAIPALTYRWGKEPGTTR